MPVWPHLNPEMPANLAGNNEKYIDLFAFACVCGYETFENKLGTKMLNREWFICKQHRRNSISANQPA